MIDGSADRAPVGTAIQAAPGGPLVRCGAELAALSEYFYGGIFAGGVTFVGVAALAALAVLPLRDEMPPGGLLSVPVLVTGLLVTATPLAVYRAAALQRLLRRRPAAEAVVVGLAALLVIHPTITQLWWPSCAILMALAVLVSPGRALGHCVVVLTIALLSHEAAGHLDELPAVTIVGLCIGYPLWTVGVAVASDRLAAHVLRLDASRRDRESAPRRVVAWTMSPAGNDTASSPRAFLPAGPSRSTSRDAIDRLTARQLQVVALLSDGMRYAEVATCLSISPRQVQRHVAQAVARLGVRNSYELVAVAVAEGLVPPPPQPSGRPDIPSC